MNKIETEHGTLLVSEYEEILKRTPIIAFNEDIIEIPKVIMFTKGTKANYVNRILNPSVEFVKIEGELFNTMEEANKTQIANPNIIVFESRTKPLKEYMLNLEALKNSAIFTRVTEDTIIVNDMIFTNNETEFIGTGIFTAKEIFYLGFGDMAKIKAMFDN